MKHQRILVSAGDPSGDAILSKIIQEIRSTPEGAKIDFVGLCGPLSKAQGVKSLAETKEVAVVGLLEVVRNLPRIFEVLGRLNRELDHVDAVICVDFPDFNLRLAQMAKKKRVPVDYVVAPQVWAWRSSRLTDLPRLIRTLYPALPFEEEIFKEAGVDARYRGHPLRDLLPPRDRRAARSELGYSATDFVLCIMPGSRHSEVRRQLPLLLNALKLFQDLRETIPGQGNLQLKTLLPLAPGWTREELVKDLRLSEYHILEDLEGQGRLKIVNDSRRAMMAADFGWITSGTATLEAAYYQLPHILLYKLNPLSVFLIRQMSQYFADPEASAGLPNILLGKRVIPELLQRQLSARNLAIETRELLADSSRLSHMKRDLRWIPKHLGEPGATTRIARELLESWAS